MIRVERRNQFIKKLMGFAVLALVPLLLNAQVKEINDGNINDQIDQEMFFQIDVPAHKINPITSKGIVTLTGTVNNLLAKERTLEVVKSVKGVKGIVDQIDVSPKPRNDLNILKDIQEALRDDPATEEYEVSIEVQNGNVTLNGKVDSRQERQLVEYVSKGVRGVTSIDNLINIVYNIDRTDAAIKAEIEQAMQHDIRLYQNLVKTKVQDGSVWLSGTVGTLNEKDLAESYAWTTGVMSVNIDGLHVHDWANNESLRDERFPNRSDQSIKESVKQAFFYDPRVKSYQPKVKVEDGIVTLSGTIDNLKARRVAEATARNIIGVVYVKNNLKYAPASSIINDKVQTKVEKAIERDNYLQQFEVDVKAWQGIVYLEGNVDNTFEKYRAENLASAQKGVQKVVNNLDTRVISNYNYLYPYANYTYFPAPYIEPGSYFEYPLTDTQIEKNIEEQMWWSPYVTSSEINVEVDQGVATLEGAIDSWSERAAAIENAYEGGAEAIIDKMKIVTNEQG